MKAVWTSLFIISTGAFLFMTGMLDRYEFAGISFGLLAVSFKPRLFKYWLLMSLIFWINLFYHWWYPPFLSPLKDLLLENDGLITRLLSLVNVCLYLVMALSLSEMTRWKPGSFQKALSLPIRKLKAAAGI